jgi:hypothetical protein
MEKAIRIMLAIGVLVGALVIGSAAYAHSCVASAGNPVDNGATISGTGTVDCSSWLTTDVETTKLWRVCTGCPDDFWVQLQDGAPPWDQANAIYRATATGCEAEDPPDDFKTEAIGNSSLHSVFAENYSELNNLDC